MAKEKAGTGQNIFSIVATKYHLPQAEFMKVLRNTVIRPGKDGKQATTEEVAAFLMVAHKYDLDPFTNEIYAYPSKKGGIIPIIGVDGFISKAIDHPDYNGMELTLADEEVTMDGAKPCPVWCEVKIYRKNTEKPTVVREYLDEVYVPPRSGYAGPWQSHTKRMLRHKAIIQGARVAFGITGLYDEDEARRIIDAEIVEAEPIAEPKAMLRSPEGGVSAEGEASAITQQTEESIVMQEEAPKRKITQLELKAHEYKEILRKLSGSDHVYYEIAGGLGFEHVTEMPPEVQAKFDTALAKKVKEINNGS